MQSQYSAQAFHLPIFILAMLVCVIWCTNENYNLAVYILLTRIALMSIRPDKNIYDKTLPTECCSACG